VSKISNTPAEHTQGCARRIPITDVPLLAESPPYRSIGQPHPASLAGKRLEYRLLEDSSE
jgi:hypothetical protein